MPILTKFILTRDINGYNGYGLPFSNSQFQSLLVSGIGDTLTVPPSPYTDYPNLIAVFSFTPGSSIWVSLNGSVSIPGGSFTPCTSELNPSARFCHGGDILELLTSDLSDQVGVTFYAVA